MKLLPVLDLMQGQIVRGIAGERARYRPVVSQLASGSNPTTIAQALADHVGCDEFYLADLDAIAGAAPDGHVYQQLAERGFQLVIDAGVGDVHRAREMARLADQNSRITGIVVGLESVGAPDFLPLACRLLGPRRAVFSLDLQGGRPITRIPSWQHRSPLDVARDAIDAGFCRLLVLDLAAVGVARGPSTVELCRELNAARYPIELWSGGGVRTPADFEALVDAGCRRVLVASALHDGNWPPRQRLPHGQP